MKKSIIKNIKFTYAINFLLSFTFYSPILTLFLKENLFSISQVTTIFSTIALTQIILEVPSGMFADNFGRRKTIILSLLVLTLSIFILAFAGSFIHFIVYAIMAATGRALFSGTDESIIYDSLKRRGKKMNLRKSLA